MLAGSATFLKPCASAHRKRLRGLTNVADPATEGRRVFNAVLALCETQKIPP
jgi:hypothetical protein